MWPDGCNPDKRLSLIKGLVRSLPQPSLRSLELALGVTNEPALLESARVDQHRA
ncbi:MAG: hypothetical protein WDN06_09240 [Asticcacaulis sp.]